MKTIMKTHTPFLFALTLPITLGSAYLIMKYSGLSSIIPTNLGSFDNDGLLLNAASCFIGSLLLSAIATFAINKLIKRLKNPGKNQNEINNSLISMMALSGFAISIALGCSTHIDLTYGDLMPSGVSFATIAISGAVLSILALTAAKKIDHPAAYAIIFAAIAGVGAYFLADSIISHDGFELLGYGALNHQGCLALISTTVGIAVGAAAFGLSYLSKSNKHYEKPIVYSTAIAIMASSILFAGLGAFDHCGMLSALGTASFPPMASISLISIGAGLIIGGIVAFVAYKDDISNQKAQKENSQIGDHQTFAGQQETLRGQ